MHVLLTVAERLHIGEAVYARPFALTRWEHMGLLESDRITGVLKEGDRVADANLAALAFHAPEKLADEHTKVQAAAGMLPTNEEAEAEAEAIAERIHAATAGRA